MLKKFRRNLKILGCAAMALSLSSTLKVGALGKGRLKGMPLETAKEFLIGIAEQCPTITHFGTYDNGKTEVHRIEVDNEVYYVVFNGRLNETDVYTMEYNILSKWFVYHSVTNGCRYTILDGIFTMIYDSNNSVCIPSE